MKIKKSNIYMRLVHRYLGFFLAGIMAIYAISGITLIFRNTDFLKSEQTIEKRFPANFKVEDLGNALRIRNFKIEREANNIIYFSEGTFDKKTGLAIFKIKKLPTLIEKLQKLHKANSSEPLFFLNIFFGVSLLFFVISSFWMFMPDTKIFKKGLLFTMGGVVLALILIFV
jgi:hypothetical protein